MNPPAAKHPSLSVGEFYTRHSEALQLRLLGSSAGFDRLIRELSDGLGVTSIVVSHDLVSIFTIADRIVMLYKGEVRLIGDREAFRATPDPIVQQFIHGRAEGPIRMQVRKL